jgi:ABC-2 type transport system ATP-binding protein
MNLLEANNINKRYHNHTALNNVSISVPAGSVYGLLGPNGAGKTSLIRIINQITGPDSGEILFQGEKLNPSHIEKIGYMPEERGLYRKMAVGEQALYLAQLKGLSKQEAQKRLKYWFEKMEIMPWWKKKVEELSKGMAQKVQFVVTVLHEPPLLIFDEPFSGFDPVNAELIKNEILELKAKGSTIIFSTHRMESVEEMCDYIALINKSEKILDGPVKEIRHRFKNNLYEVDFEGNWISFGNALWAGFELVSKEEVDGVNKAHVRLLGSNTPNDLLNAVLPVCKLHGFKELIPTVNEIFISLVTGQPIGVAPTKKDA